MKTQISLIVGIVVALTSTQAANLGFTSAGLGDWQAVGKSRVVDEKSGFKPAKGAGFIAVVDTAVGAVDDVSWLAAGGNHILSGASSLTDPQHPHYKPITEGSLITSAPFVVATPTSVGFSVNTYHNGEGESYGTVALVNTLTGQTVQHYGLGTPQIVAKLLSDNGEFAYEWGWHNSDFFIQDAGTYQLVTGLVDYGGKDWAAAVALDNITITGGLSPVVRESETIGASLAALFIMAGMFIFTRKVA